jgi:enoyl-CoA hydratase/carnithine racemase
MGSTVAVDIDAHIANVTLNRPEKMNAVSMEMFAELGEVGSHIASDPSVRVVVLSGAGDCFCAGIDTTIFAQDGLGIDASAMAPVAPSPANVFQRAAYVWREVPVPVLCAIQGVAYGAGLQIALGADIRYAAPDARFSIMEAKYGLIPDMAIAVTARSVTPLDRIKELAFTARIVDAAAALDMGLITAVHDEPLAAARKTAREIAARSPSAVRSIKQLFDEGWHATDPEALALEARLQSALLGADHQREAVLASIEKRTPNFSD